MLKYLLWVALLLAILLTACDTAEPAVTPAPVAEAPTATRQPPPPTPTCGCSPFKQLVAFQVSSRQKSHLQSFIVNADGQGLNNFSGLPQRWLGLIFIPLLLIQRPQFCQKLPLLTP
ncbi:MAG: hypothetical protein DPW09_41445 [Anaerolineae bacterium]|nr:hypothetical protein [Anaerolineales bacterium]MCQ3979926.1 hypothetical protein [Anaerolineae bacterium]